MRKTTISITDAARHFADCVNRAHYQNVTFVLLRNGLPVARLEPEAAKVCLGRDLAQTLAKTELPDAEASAWWRDLKTGRRALKTPGDQWR